MTQSMRTEHDLLGSRDVPARAYYGVHTLRAVENFPISGTPVSVYPDLINALASVVKGQLAARFLADQLGLNLFVSKPEARLASAGQSGAGRAA